MKFSAFILLLFSNLYNLLASPLIAPDTVYISPANYNPYFENIGNYTLFNIIVDNPSGLEIISMASFLNYNLEDQNDKSKINTIPSLYANKNGNIVLENGSTIEIKANIFFENPSQIIYEADFIINYKTKEFGFKIDTVHIIAQRNDSQIYTKKHTVTLDLCDETDYTEPIKIYSTLLNGSNENLTINDIKVSSNVEYNIIGYLHKLYDYDNPAIPNINFPYQYNNQYFTIEFEVKNKDNTNNFIYVDYYTNKGIYRDTVSLAFTKKKGITAKSFFQQLESQNYNEAKSEKLAVKLCSEQGYRINSVNLEGDFDKNEIQLEEYFVVGDVIIGNYIELSQFKIKPNKIPSYRSGAFIYELENMQNGNILYVDFPFSLTVDFNTSVNEEYINTNMKLYPNPADDYIFTDKYPNLTDLILINSVGNIVIQKQNPKSVDVSNLAPGFYIVRLITTDGIFNEKLIIR